MKRSSGGGEPQCFNLCVASLSLQRLLQPAELRLGFWQQDGNGAANLAIFDTELDDDNLDREPEESLQEDSGEAGALADEPQADLDAPPPKRCRGRPPGLPKTGGRQKGSPRSYGAPEVRQELLSRSNAIEVLADICAGKKPYCGSGTLGNKPSWQYPSMKDCLRALEIVLSKVVPDLQATELSGAGGEALFPTSEPLNLSRTVSAIFSVLREAGLRNAVAAPRSPYANVLVEKQLAALSPSENSTSARDLACGAAPEPEAKPRRNVHFRV